MGTAQADGVIGGGTPPPDTGGTTTIIDDHTLIVTAGSERDLTLTATPGRGDGRVIKCGWFQAEFGDLIIFDIVQLRDPVAGETYMLWCWYADDGTDVPGFPVRVVYQRPVIAGEPATTEETTLFALDSITFAAPALALSPAGEQVVGIPTWLAVTSQLDYPQVSAAAGPVWATVQPVFRDVTWDMGNGDTVTCTLETDATTTWDPTGPPDQTSSCVYVYESNGEGDGEVHLSATVSWTILQRTNLNPNWHTWGTLSLTTTAPVTVRELQAVID